MLTRSVLMIPLMVILLVFSQQDVYSFTSYQHNRRIPKRMAKFEETENQQGTIRTTLRRAKSLYERGKYGKAQKLFTEVLQNAKRNQNLITQSQALEGLGLTFSAFQKLPESIYTLQQALQINNNLNNSKGRIRTAKILSDVYYSNGSYDSALLYAGVSMQGAAVLKMNHEIDNARLAKIAALIRLKRWKECDSEITLFKEVHGDNNEPSLFVQFQSLMGNYNLARGKPDIGQHYYDLASDKATASNRPELLTIVYGNMIDSYYDKGDYKKGLYLLEKYKEIRNIQPTGENTEIVFHTDLYKNEIYNLNIEKKLKNLQLRQDAEEIRTKDLKLVQGNAERSILKRNSLLKDSLLLLKDSLLETERLLNDARARESNSEKLRLQKIKELRELQLKEAGRLTTILIVGLGTVMLLGSLAFYQYNLQRKKNGIIEKQKEELQILMREIHHRVKNNLQVISSLLDLQSHSIQDAQASEAIKEGKNRVQSMALIHQKLYGERSIQRINVKDYIDNLAQGLIESYNIKPGSIQINTDIDNLELDVDTVIPLGLILNELISNSLKHAFKTREQGEMQIVLQEKEHSLFLKVKDNGQGFSPGTNSPGSTSFGMKLIKAFATKLKAKLEMYNEDGACVVMHIHRKVP